MVDCYQHISSNYQPAYRGCLHCSSINVYRSIICGIRVDNIGHIPYGDMEISIISCRYYTICHVSVTSISNTIYITYIGICRYFKPRYRLGTTIDLGFGLVDYKWVGHLWLGDLMSDIDIILNWKLGYCYSMPKNLCLELIWQKKCVSILFK